MIKKYRLAGLEIGKADPETFNNRHDRAMARLRAWVWRERMKSFIRRAAAPVVILCCIAEILFLK